MPPEGEMAAQGAANNSSDFVRKLYKMLEDPAYSHIVRWGNEGDSFVVLENEKFTKTILPKHFKHSNFASFVRQLNKYDFHKVRQNEENGQSPYGPGAWEFKHPEFHQNKRDNLDNIRRKAPAPRKAPVPEESFPAAQQIVLLNEQLVATQHQVQALQEQYMWITHTNKLLADEVLSLQKAVKAQSQVHHELISHLNNADERRRNSRHSQHSSHSSHSGPAFHGGGMNMLPDAADEPPPELRRAREILNGIAHDPAADRELERINAMMQTGSPPDSATSSIMYNQPNSAAMPVVADNVGDMKHMVYPMGQTAGIDPFHADHINNIPYTRPLSNPNTMADVPAQITPPPAKDAGGSLWGQRKPKILLVEDDKTCARIGAKFLSQVEASVDIARDGSEAVSNVNANPDKYDLIFMDIIMPVFDGVSATACIRMVQPRVPIIAMTSNIRGEDIATYFQWGMNDVLAKPFTKDGMVRILKKHLSYLLKNPPGPGEDLGHNGGMQAPAGYTSAGMTMGPGGASGMATAGGQMKFETTPIQSPAATTASWHSPGGGQMTQASPNLDATSYMNAVNVNGSSQMPITPGGTHRPQFQGGMVPHVGTPPIRGMQDGMMEGPPEKRQRMYGPGQVQYGQ